MAGNTTEATTVATESNTSSEIDNLKAAFPEYKIRVIENLGNIPYMVTVTMAEFGMQVKLQLDGDYPASSPCVISKPTTEDTAHLAGSLTSHLEGIASRTDEKTVLALLVKSAKEWLSKENIVINEKTESPRGKKNKQKKKKNKQKPEDEVYDEKKPPMKTATDVISRIQWDTAINPETITVGYMDRMVGLVEKQFTAFSWEDIASVDYNVLAIPKHRIQYFKYKDVKVWDKNDRLDNVFGSLGGRTITYVIEEYEKRFNGPAARAHQYEYVTDSSDDDDDDGFVIKTGCEPQFEAKSATVTTQAEKTEEDTLYPKETYWGKKARPTHFIALRLTDPEIVKNVTEALQTMEEIEPSYKMCMIPPERLHITLACVGLDTEEDIRKASNVLHKIRPELERFDPKNIEVTVKGVGDFFRCVLYGRVEENVQFMDFAQQLRMCVKHEGIEIRDVFDFNPHMTLLKMKQQHKVELRSKFLDIDRLSEPFKEKLFGSQKVDSIYLCSMGEEKQADGFYISPSKVCFI